jgi:hypothetical protein
VTYKQSSASRVKQRLTKRAADRASPWWYGAGLLAMVVVCGGVLPVRPAANANRWVADVQKAGVFVQQLDMAGEQYR